MSDPMDDTHQEQPQNITRRNLAAGLVVLASAVAAPTGAQAFFLFRRRRRRNRNSGGSCFVRGTRILTPVGMVEVEKLREGDVVQATSGQRHTVKRIVSWSAKRKPQHDWTDDVAPIKISRSALAPNVPQCDLYLSPNHAVYMDGELIQARWLVNGRSIVRCSRYEADELSYFHVELDDHQVISAEGAQVESLLADGMTPFAPVTFGGRKAELASRLRSASSPWLDRRTVADKVRDRLDERAFNWPRAA